MEEYSRDKKQIVMTRDHLRAFDAFAINQLGIPGTVLMENAGRSCAELIKEKLTDIPTPKVCILCGTGNNGGDGYVIARHLLNSGFNVTVAIVGDSGKVKGDAKINLDILEKLGQPIGHLNPNEDIASQLENLVNGADMLVDSLFGTGLSGRLGSGHIEVINSINELDIPVLAVDIPSGLDCDTGRPLGTAIKATYTVTFVALKTGFVANKSTEEYTGKIYIASIGVEPDEEAMA